MGLRPQQPNTIQHILNSICIGMFGGLSVHDGETEIRAFGTSRAAKLLTLLILSRTGRMQREHLADLLWPEDFYDATRLRMRQEIHRLKRALGPHSSLIGASGSEVWVDRAAFKTDLDELAGMAAGHMPKTISPLLWETFLPDWSDAWVVAERRRVEQLQVRVALAVSKRLLHDGLAEEALHLVQRMICHHPLNEDLRKISLSAHAALGSMVAALAEYQDYRRQVKEQLGVDAPDPSGGEVGGLALRAAKELEERDWSRTVPSVPEPIFGRQDLIDSVLEWLQSTSGARMLTLIGPGGIGKTRLAIEVAQAVRDTRLARSAFIGLAEVADPKTWAMDALSQLKEDLPSTSDVVHYLAAILAREPTLLVLDNLETVLPDAAEQIGLLLDQAPGLRILATSVSPSGALGEKLVQVGGIDPHEAGLAVLEAAYREFRPRAEIDAGSRQALEKIAVSLDGYPLALRLASSRLRFLSPQELHRQLELALSRPASGNLPERHRSLATALASSIESLTPELRSSLEQISAFPGGLGMDLAADLLGGDTFFDTLEALLDRSLLVLDDQYGHARVRMLSPIRKFVRGMMDEETRGALDACFARHTLSYLDRFDVAPWKSLSIDVLDRLDAEADNLLPAWTWAAEHDPAAAYRAAPKLARLESSRGRSGHFLKALTSLGDLHRNVSSRLQFSFDLCTVFLCIAAHQEESAAKPLERAASAHTADPDWRAVLACADALVSYRRDFFQSEGKAETALGLALEVGDPYLVSRSRRILGWVAYFTQRYKLSIDHISMAYESMEACGADSEMPSVAIFLAGALWQAGRREEAEHLMEQANTLLPKTRDPASRAYFHETRGRMLLDGEDLPGAESQFRESLRIWEAIGSHYQEADQLHCLTQTLLRQGRIHEARRTLISAADRWVSDENKGGLCCSLILVAELLCIDGNHEAAGRVIAFSREFEVEHSVILVEHVMNERERVAHMAGEDSGHSWPVTFKQARALFDLIR
jgi:predicted ATPase/DNA-binding SARP family transcriptional activator